MLEDENKIAIENLKEIRVMINNESSLQNNRLTWMITSQALLLAASGALWGKSFKVITALGVLGILSSTSIGFSLLISCKANRILKDRGTIILNRFPYLPPVIGYWAPKRSSWFLPWNLLPWVFAVFWLVLWYLAYLQQTSWPLCP